MTADLSPVAIAARAAAKAKTGQDGGYTGQQLITVAAGVFDQANRARKQADRTPPGHRRQKLEALADEALRTAALQIRLAQLTPLDRGYLHALDLPRIQTAREDVGRIFAADPAALAVDVHRRIADQRQRLRAEGAPPAPNRAARRRRR